MTDKYIMEQMQKHWKCALELFPEDRIVGLFIQGSQNYYLEDEESDIDTKLLVVPSVEDIVLNRKAESTTYYIKDGKLVYDEDSKATAEHMDAKDIRLYWGTLKKANINFVEILFARCKIVNPMYEALWNEVEEIREDIAYMNPLAAMKAMMGMVNEKYFALTHKYPSRVYWLDTYGYDPKQLHHLIRIQMFMEQYIHGHFRYESLVRGDHLMDEEKRWLIDMKRTGVGILEQAQCMADYYKGQMEDLYNKAKGKYSGEADEFVVDKMDSLMADIVKLSIKKEIL